jgi:hypothetical protein
VRTVAGAGPAFAGGPLVSIAQTGGRRIIVPEDALLDMVEGHELEILTKAEWRTVAVIRAAIVD